MCDYLFILYFIFYMLLARDVGRSMIDIIGDELVVCIYYYD